MTTPTSAPTGRILSEAHDDGQGNGAMILNNRDLLMPADRFVKRHIGPRSHDVTKC